MLGLFRKKVDTVEICSPLGGRCVELAEVEDPVFSEKVMGDGIAVRPTENVVKAPCSGKLTMIFPTKHAFGITTDDGVEILVHIGINTVDLNGKGFKTFKAKDAKIKTGDAIIEFDRGYLDDGKTNMTTMVIITESNGGVFEPRNVNESVKSGDILLSKMRK